MIKSVEIISNEVTKYTFTEKELQRLIDLIFELSMKSGPSYRSKEGYNRDEHMAWVAKALKDSGINTIPMGMSWGVLRD